MSQEILKTPKLQLSPSGPAHFAHRGHYSAEGGKEGNGNLGRIDDGFDANAVWPYDNGGYRAGRSAATTAAAATEATFAHGL